MAKAREKSKLKGVCAVLQVKCIKELSILLYLTRKRCRHLMFYNVVQLYPNRLELSCIFHVVIG